MLISCSFFMPAAGLSTALGILSVFLWNNGPLKWICEYGERPDCRHKNRDLPYPAFTAIFSLFFLLYCFANFYFSAKAPLPFLELLVVFCLLQLSISDLKFHILQDQWILAAAVSGFWFGCPLNERLLGLSVPVLWYAGTALLFRHKENLSPFGMGDVKLLGCLGLCFGICGLYVISCIALISSGVWSLGLLVLKKATKKDRIAFGPFIAFACIYFMLST